MEKVPGAWQRERQPQSGALPGERSPGEVATSYLHLGGWPQRVQGNEVLLLANSEAAHVNA